VSFTLIDHNPFGLGRAGGALFADEIKVALIDIMGTISAMVEQSLPNDLKAWADEVAAQFAASFQAARSSMTAQDLQLLQPLQ
jgi:hypothetical protein